MADPQRFHWSDYVVFFGVMAISVGIGLYHAFTGDKQKKSSEYFLGNKQLWVVPVAMSVVVSMVSSNTVLGVPSEVYGYGSTYIWYGVSGGLAFIFAAVFIVPLLYPLELTSIYEYFERRYGGFFGKVLRWFTMFLQVVTQIFFVATVVYGPAIALEVATGIPTRWLLIIIPVAGIIYTSLGGIKGVVYADAFQCFMMVAGQLVVVGVGLSKLDKITDVWDESWYWDRIQPDDNHDPTARSTLFSITIGGFFTGLSAFGTNQAVMQRALGTKSKTKAQLAYVISGPLLLITQFIAVSVGWVLFAYYASVGCDPIKNGNVKRADQILPYFIMEVINYPTVPGFFFASVLCGSLSTISSSINAVSAVIWDDVLVICFGKIGDLGQSIIRKVVSVLFGGLIIGAAFVLEENRGNTTLVGIVFSVFGALQGPVLAMFLFSSIFPYANGPGTLIGGICAVSMTILMTVGRTELGAGFQRLPVPEGKCSVANATNMAVNVTEMVTSAVNVTTTEATKMSSTDDKTDLEWFYSISFWYYPVISTIVVFIIGSIISQIMFCFTRETQKKFLVPLVRSCAGKYDDKDDTD